MKSINKFLNIKDFLILWISQAVSSLGSGMTAYALIIWIYNKQGTATSVALLSFFTYLPSVLLCFIAGTIADKWDKKKIMLVTDFIAALGTLTVFILFNLGELKIWHLYLVNFLIGFMNAFQKPASYVAISLLVKKEQYAKVSGMQGLSNSVVNILTPVFASLILAFGGLNTIFILDLVSFLIAFFSLLIFIKPLKIHLNIEEKKESFIKRSMEGIGFLRSHKALMKLILYMCLIDLLAYISGYGILPAMILARSGNNETTLGMVSSAVGVAMLLGSVLVTFMKPVKKKTRAIFLTMAISFLFADVLWAIGRNSFVWVFASFCGNVLVPFTGASLSVIMRTNVPIELQGRVFSARDTLQYSSIPFAFFISGLLSDRILEPLMESHNIIQRIFSVFVGEGKGSGMAILFLFTGIIGVIASLISLKDPDYKSLD